MDKAIMPSNRPYSVRLPFTSEQSDRFAAFLKATGRKAGPWLRTLAIKAMDEEQSRDGLRDLAKAESGGAA
ncbi:MAG TPA: hypothetical protein PLI66_06665 [Spirochaetales bacterium]|nr:hypothetical protein [Spirochaetales bacterium]